MAESDRNMRRIFLTIGIMAMAAGLPAGAAHCLTPAQSTAAAARARSDATARARLDAEAKARADALAAARAKPDAAQLQKKAAIELFLRSQETARLRSAPAMTSPYVVANPAKSALAKPAQPTQQRSGAAGSVTSHHHPATASRATSGSGHGGR